MEILKKCIINILNNMQTIDVTSKLITNLEKYIQDYKVLLEDIGRNKHLYPDSELREWFKTYIREEKNNTEILLKKFVKEKTYQNQGFNHPSCYPY